MAAGIPPWRLWALTPSEVRLAVQGVDERIKVEREFAVRLTWLGEALARKKRLPRPERLLRNWRRQKLPRLTKAERESRIAAIEAQFPDEPAPAAVAMNGSAHGG